MIGAVELVDAGRVRFLIDHDIDDGGIGLDSDRSRVDEDITFGVVAVPERIERDDACGREERKDGYQENGAAKVLIHSLFCRRKGNYR